MRTSPGLVLRRLLPLLIPGLLCLACAVGPDYEAPELDTPDRWHLDLSNGLAEGEADLQTWWTVLDDEILSSLIERAYEGSKDLEQAVARVRQARSGLGIAKGGRVPEVDGVGEAQRRRVSDNSVTGGDGGGTDSFFRLGVDATWELDLWGRVRRSVESADASFAASVEAYRDTLVVVFADVATNYVDVRSFQERLRYAYGNVETQRKSLRLTRDLREAGIVGDLDVRQAELNLARTESLIPALEQGLAAAIHRVAVLLGQLPATLYAELGPEGPIPEPPPEVLIGLPADLLRQRPDIREAERLVASSSARIGVATADLYPRFSLSGTFTVDATSVSDLFEWDSRTFGIGPTFRWNVFSGGRVRATIGVEEARTEEALSFYEQTVLAGYEDVENAIVSFVQEQIRRDALERSVVAARDAVRLVNVLYRQGLTEFQNVLDTEQLLFEQEDLFAESRGLVTQNLIRLYRALGGGWEP